MRIGALEVTLHRTVRVADGRQPANLPPSLGRMTAYPVKQYRERCPDAWEDEAVFVGLHDTEALWMSFSTPHPLAVIVGAGGINALTGKPLGTKLEVDGYLVAPPQPWLDGWKSPDGTVYQFVATPYKKGEGLSVGEQVLGAESKSGGIGIAVFESKEPLAPKNKPMEGYGGSAYGDIPYGDIVGASAKPVMASLSATPTKDARSAAFDEMGVGKGGKIIQKVYEDPHGIAAWKDEPGAVSAIYLVHAELLAEITGTPIQTPVTQENYSGNWFGLNDTPEPDVQGSEVFTGLKTVFAPEKVEA